MTKKLPKPDPAAEAAKPVFHPIHRGRGRSRKVNPEQAAEPVRLADQAQPAESVQPAPAERCAPESAVNRAERLRGEISTAEAEHGGIVAELAGLAIGCEAGEPSALARRAALRGDLAALADRAGDKRAALAVVLPLAEAERAQWARAQRDAAFAEATKVLGFAEGWALAMDRAVDALVHAAAKHRECQAWIMRGMVGNVPEGSLWLYEQDANALESVLLARLVRLGVFDPIHAPGVLYDGQATMREAVTRHGDSVRARLAAIQSADDRQREADAETTPEPQPRVAMPFGRSTRSLLPAA